MKISITNKNSLQEITGKLLSFENGFCHFQTKRKRSSKYITLTIGANNVIYLHKGKDIDTLIYKSTDDIIVSVMTDEILSNNGLHIKCKNEEGNQYINKNYVFGDDGVEVVETKEKKKKIKTKEDKKDKKEKNKKVKNKK